MASVAQLRATLRRVGSNAPTAPCTLNEGTLVSFQKPGKHEALGVIQSFSLGNKTVAVTIVRAMRMSDYVQEYEDATGKTFALTRKGAQKMVEGLDFDKGLVLSPTKTVEVTLSQLKSVGILLDSGKYRSLYKTIPAPSFVFWNLFELDQDEDLSMATGDTPPLFSYSNVNSTIAAPASNEAIEHVRVKAQELKKKQWTCLKPCDSYIIRTTDAHGNRMHTLGMEKFILLRNVSVEAARVIGKKLNAVAGKSGMTWHAKFGEEFLTLRVLDFLLGRNWDSELQVNRLGENVRVFVHDRLLDAVEVKYNASTQTLAIRVPYTRELHPGTPQSELPDLFFARPADVVDGGAAAAQEAARAAAAAANTRAIDVRIVVGQGAAIETGSVTIPRSCTLRDARCWYFLLMPAPECLRRYGSRWLNHVTFQSAEGDSVPRADEDKHRLLQVFPDGRVALAMSDLTVVVEEAIVQEEEIAMEEDIVQEEEPQFTPTPVRSAARRPGPSERSHGKRAAPAGAAGGASTSQAAGHSAAEARVVRRRRVTIGPPVSPS